MTEPTPLFRMEGISKRYGGVRALEQAELTVHAGRVHAILGENGAGKSTLIKVMSGVVAPDAGRMLLDGQPVTFASPSAANDAGIVCIFQELSLIPDLSVADNIVISNPPTWLGMIDRSAQQRIAVEALQRAGGGDIDPREIVKNLPLSRRQIVEIAKALARRPRVLILDEATSALTAADVTTVFGVLKRLRDEGIALLYISHRMQEIAELADDCTVFRNGRNVATYKAGTRSDSEVVELMIGREYTHKFPPRATLAANSAPPMLETRNLTWPPRLNGISLTVRAGEVVGLGGLDGQGQRELLLALFGVLRGVTGEVLINGAPRAIGSPRAAKAEGTGMALIPEDRKTEGLMLPMSVRDNLTFASLGQFSRGGMIDQAAETRAVDEMIKLLDIKTDGIGAPGGVAVGWKPAKDRHCQVADDRSPHHPFERPHARHRRWHQARRLRLLRRLADAGAAILLYSTDYDELIGCCDRVLVLYDGSVKRELAGDQITERALIASALNIEMAPTLAKAVAE